jgi:hypothetical protein
MSTKDNVAVATKIMELLAGGKTMEQAIAELNLVPGGTHRHDPQAIAKMTDLQVLRQIRKSAFAKLSKGSKNADTLRVYEEEKNSSTKRIAELLKIIKNDPKPHEKAKEFNEELSARTQFFLDYYQALLGKILAKATAQLSKAGYKALIAQAKPSMEGIPEEFAPTIKERFEHNDLRVITILKTNGLYMLAKSRQKKEVK